MQYTTIFSLCLFSGRACMCTRFFNIDFSISCPIPSLQFSKLWIRSSFNFQIITSLKNWAWKLPLFIIFQHIQLVQMYPIPPGYMLCSEGKYDNPSPVLSQKSVSTSKWVTFLRWLLITIIKYYWNSVGTMK